MFGPDDFEVQIQQENPPGIHAEPSIRGFYCKTWTEYGWKISSCE